MHCIDITQRKMLWSSENDGNLFNRLLKFQVTNVQSAEVRTAELLLSLEWQPQSASMQRKVLTIKVSDEDDPFFSYILNLDNEAYTKLKQQQGLLIDFLSFPQSFISLLELCISNEEKCDAKYVLNLILDTKSQCKSAQLEIVEENRFKMIRHLSLKLAALSDEHLKECLFQSFKKMKDEKESMARSRSEIEHQYSQYVKNTQETLRFKDEELVALRKEMQSEKEKNKRNCFDEMNIEKQKLIQGFEEERKMMDIQLKNKDSMYQKEVKDLRDRARNAEKLYKEAQENLKKMGESHSEAQDQIKSLEKDSKSLSKHLEMFQQQNRGLESDLREARIKLAYFESDMTMMKQHDAKKDEEISHLRGEVEILEEERFRIEEELRQAQSLLSQNQQKITQLSTDIETGNDIIRAMQTEAHANYNKMRDKNLLLNQLQARLAEKEKHELKLEGVANKLYSVKKAYEKEILKLRKDNVKLQTELSEMKDKFGMDERINSADEDERLDSSAHAEKSTDENSLDVSNTNPGAKQKRSVTFQSGHSLDPKYLQKNNNLVINGSEDSSRKQHLLSKKILKKSPIPTWTTTKNSAPITKLSRPSKQTASASEGAFEHHKVHELSSKKVPVAKKASHS